MSDLISRSDLLNEFNNKNIQITFDLPVEEVLTVLRLTGHFMSEQRMKCLCLKKIIS